ncbi:hypothetical protein Cph01nite_18170 [Cellulomonas phragmiteti]|uniref:Uncharacterized protein n=1 Tax=Cellulomonas phragmiteti TaxID=478780 RepID=A0ABQ4DL27_9CELL|nr:hypothetical protein Cph01nite_18170 [Cellulomonas phragmiteti]
MQIRYEALPARAVCVWDVDGERREVVVASVPAAVTVGALALAVGGIAGTVLVLVTARTARRAAATGRGGPPGPAPAPDAS